MYTNNSYLVVLTTSLHTCEQNCFTNLILIIPVYYSQLPPVSPLEPLLLFVQRDKGEDTGSDWEHEGQKGQYFCFIIFTIVLLFLTIRCHVIFPFLSISHIREKGEPIKAYLKFLKIAPFYFSFPFILPFAERYQQLVN